VPVFAAEPERLSLTEPSDFTPTISQGARVVISFNIQVPEARATLADNIAQFVQGKHELLPALEQALEGMKPGEEKRVELGPDQAFGPYDDAKKTTIPRDTLPREIQPGTILTSRDGHPFTVVELNEQQAVIDYNHPLAGKRLVFDVKVLKVERPS
jgi:FKBP-type peptidyl-prolyl cis-trans isomerase 2